jgi:hypothetical protein
MSFLYRAGFCVKLITEKKREFNLGTHLAFIDYEKDFDKVKKRLIIQKIYQFITDYNKYVQKEFIKYKIK